MYIIIYDMYVHIFMILIYIYKYIQCYMLYMYIYISSPRCPLGQQHRPSDSHQSNIQHPKNQVQPCRVFIWISPKQNKQFLCKDGAFRIYIQKNNTTCFCLNQFRPVFRVWSRGHQIRSGQIMDVTSISWRYRSGLKDPVVCGEATT